MNGKLRVARVLVLSLATAFVAAAAFSGAAQAKTFITQNGNVRCFMRSHFVRCDVAKHSWTAPPQPKSCDFDYGFTLEIDRHGNSGFGCVSDATGATVKYPPGTSFRTGPNVCLLRSHGKVLCKNDGGGGFNVGRKFYKLF